MTLPRGWVKTVINDTLTQLRTGPFGSAVHKSDYVGDGVPLINPMHIAAGQIRPSKGMSVGLVKAQELHEFRLAANDVILGRRGEMGRCAVVTENETGWLIGTGSMALTPSDAIIPSFLQKYLSSESVVMALEGRAVGSTMVNLNQTILLELGITLPPLAEQRRIVAKLDALTARLVRARAELDRVPVLAGRLRRQAMLACYDLAGAPRVALADLLKGIEAGKNLRCEERPPQGGERGVVKVSAVTWGRFDLSQSKTLPNDYVAPPKARIRKGDLLISRANTLELVGAVALVEEQPNDLFLSDKVLRLVVDDADKKWVLWFLRSPKGRRQIENLATGNQLSMRNISQDALRRIELPYPVADVRKEATDRLEAAFVHADRLEAEAARARALLDRLESAILAKAFRGELVPQDPADEPASLLLDRIRARRAAHPMPKRGRQAAVRA